MIRLLKSHLDSCPEAQREKLDCSLPSTPSRPADTQTIHLSQHRPAPCFGGGRREAVGDKTFITIRNQMEQTTVLEDITFRGLTLQSPNFNHKVLYQATEVE